MPSPPLVPRFPAASYAAVALLDTALAGSASPALRRLRGLTKPLLMPALGSAFAAATPDAPGSLLRKGTVAAQALSGVGDVALLSKTETAFLLGLSSFFGAHVSYTAAFVSAGRPLGDREALAGPAVAAGVAATVGPLMSWAAGRKDPTLRGPVLAYAGALATMFAASTRLDPDLPPPARRKVVAGTSLFLLSDAVLATRRFLLPHAGPRSDAVVMATYTLGQGLIAAGVAESVRHRQVTRGVTAAGRPAPGPRPAGSPAAS